MGSAMSLVASENGPIVMPTGSRSVELAMYCNAPSRAMLPEQPVGLAPMERLSCLVIDGRGEVEPIRLSLADPQARQQVGLV